MQEVQVILPGGPQWRLPGFHFHHQPESMGRVDSKGCVSPGPANSLSRLFLPWQQAAQIFMTLGIPFSAKAYLLRMAKDSGIEWMDEVM